MRTSQQLLRLDEMARSAGIRLLAVSACERKPPPVSAGSQSRGPSQLSRKSMHFRIWEATRNRVALVSVQDFVAH